MTHFIQARFVCMCVCAYILATEVYIAKYTAKTLCGRSTFMTPLEQSAEFDTCQLLLAKEHSALPNK